jgi:hypothetical protein
MLGRAQAFKRETGITITGSKLRQNQNKKRRKREKHTKNQKAKV